MSTVPRRPSKCDGQASGTHPPAAGSGFPFAPRAWHSLPLPPGGQRGRARWPPPPGGGHSSPVTSSCVPHWRPVTSPQWDAGQGDEASTELSQNSPAPTAAGASRAGARRGGSGGGHPHRDAEDEARHPQGLPRVILLSRTRRLHGNQFGGVTVRTRGQGNGRSTPVSTLECRAWSWDRSVLTAHLEGAASLSSDTHEGEA